MSGLFVCVSTLLTSTAPTTPSHVRTWEILAHRFYPLPFNSHSFSRRHPLLETGLQALGHRVEVDVRSVKSNDLASCVGHGGRLDVGRSCLALEACDGLSQVSFRRSRSYVFVSSPSPISRIRTGWKFTLLLRSRHDGSEESDEGQECELHFD